MDHTRTPIGGMHSRDFQPLREQRPLSDLKADGQGYIHFGCLKCPRTQRIELATLRARFAPDEGLVNVLNTIAPDDCALAGVDPWGHRPCGFCYRDLGGPNG